MAMEVQENAIFSDIIHVEFEEKLASVAGGTITKARLREFVFNRAKDLLVRLHPDWLGENKITKDAFDRLCQMNMRIDFSRSLTQIMREFNEAEAQRSIESQDIVDERAKEVRNFLFHDEACKHASGVNARIHRGGQTRLHVEACDGNLDAVRNLVENCNASLTIEDNAGMTAEQACFYMGRIEIANYLKHRRLGL
jgi:hypothetical protein